MSYALIGLRARALLALCYLAVLIGAAPARVAGFGAGFKKQSVDVGGGAVSVTVGGSGPAVLLLHGYAEMSRMWKPLAQVLAPHLTVIAPICWASATRRYRRRAWT